MESLRVEIERRFPIDLSALYMNTLPIVFAIVIGIPALAVGVTIWWMFVHPDHRPDDTADSLDQVPLMGKFLLCGLFIGLLVFGVGASGLW
jgi:hypothetical protein